MGHILYFDCIQLKTIISILTKQNICIVFFWIVFLLPESEWKTDKWCLPYYGNQKKDLSIQQGNTTNILPET